MTLHDRIRDMLRDTRPPVISEREALTLVAPHGQGVMAVPANPPLKPTTPLGIEPGGALGELAFDGPDST